MAKPTTPGERGDIETDAEYADYTADLNRTLELARPGDLLEVTRSSDPPCPHMVRVTRETATSVFGEAQDGSEWELAFVGGPVRVTEVGSDVAVTVRGFAFKQLA